MSGIMSMLLGAVSSAAAAVDEFFNRVTLLLPGNGTNGAQNNTFLDSSSNNFTITRNGNTTQGTFSPFSQTGWSNYFDGSGDYLQLSSNAAFSFGTSDFTIEAWFYSSTLPTLAAGGDGIFTAIGSVGLYVASDGVRITQAGTAVLNDVSTTIVTNTWYHLALTRTGTSMRVFLNGTQVGATLTNSTNFSNTGNVRIGTETNQDFDGYISNLRVLKGTAQYTANFTPPTAPLTAITNTSLLTCQSNRFVDNSTNGFAITVNGTTSVQAFSPFAPTAAYSAATVGGSGYFDGSGDYLTAAGNAAFAFGTGDFTVAAWVYPTNTLATTVLSSNYNYSSGVGNWSLYFSSGTPATLYFNSSSGNKASTVTTTIPLNAWTHVAYTRVGTTGRFFVNGVQLGGTISDSFNYGGSSGNLFVGQQSDGTGLWYGYMTSIQVLKGTGYSSLPIPTSPATNITNTSLLLNFTNAGITDATAKNDLETVGNAQISTTQSKFGGSSMYFNGTSSLLKFPPSQLFNFSNGDFTIEFWVYRAGNGSSDANRLIQFADGDTFTGINIFEMSGSASIYVSTSGSGWEHTAAIGSISTSWSHIAIARSGSNLRGFLNGSNVLNISLGTSSIFFSATQTPIVGGQTGSRFFNGYIDDLRITRGYARYTANFTPPTSAFALQ